jgi:hypothetical protein
MDRDRMQPVNLLFLEPELSRDLNFIVKPLA